MHRESGGETFIAGAGAAALWAATLSWSGLRRWSTGRRWPRSSRWSTPRRAAGPPIRRWLMVKRVAAARVVHAVGRAVGGGTLGPGLIPPLHRGRVWTPDAPERSTVSRFRLQLVRRGLARPLFDRASTVSWRRKAFRCSSRARCWTPRWSRRRSAGPRTVRARAQRMSSATRTASVERVKGGRSYFGYQGHLGVDQGSGLVRRAELHPAHVNETTVAVRLDRRATSRPSTPTAPTTDNARIAGACARPGSRTGSNTAATSTWPSCRVWQRRRNELIERRSAAFGYGSSAPSSSHYGYRQRIRYLGLPTQHARTALQVHRLQPPTRRYAASAARSPEDPLTQPVRRPERSARAHRRRITAPRSAAILSRGEGAIRDGHLASSLMSDAARRRHLSSYGDSAVRHPDRGSAFTDSRRE